MEKKIKKHNLYISNNLNIFIIDVKHSLMEDSIETVLRNDQTYIHK